MRKIPFKIGRAPCLKERRDLQHSYFMDSCKGFFSFTEGGLSCLRGSRAKRRPTADIRETNLEIERGLAGLS